MNINEWIENNKPINNIILGDCLEGMKQLKDNSIDLVVTDPPYLINNTNAGGKSKFSREFQKMNTELLEAGITKGFNQEILNEFVRVLKKINIYIWCNHKQILEYLKFFVDDHNCKFDIIIWNKTNSAPTFNNKYLTDKEFCLYFRKGGFCNPINHRTAKTIYYQPTNVKDKNSFGHPTIKPINIIKNLILNSSNKNDIVLDAFMGSGTTAVACKELGRNFIGFEINEKYCSIIKERLRRVNNKKLNGWFK